MVDFCTCFTVAWAGWEGAAHDACILAEALRNPDLQFFHRAGKKYYLIDAEYPHKRVTWLLIKVKM